MQESGKNRSAKQLLQTDYAPLSSAVSWTVVSLLTVMAAGIGCLYLIPMNQNLGQLVFPFDDAWIPLNYARTLFDHGTYAFHTSMTANSGSTSPLYVFLLAFFGLFANDLMIPAFILGIAGTAATAIFLFLTAKILFKDDQWIAVAVAVLFIFIPVVHSSMVSGMSTMLYTAALTGSVYLYYSRRTVLFCALSAVTIWLRPDALIFLIAVAIHMIFTHFIAHKVEPAMNDETRKVAIRHLIQGIVIYLVITAGYVVFNLSLGAGIFPSSVAAKLAYFGLVPSDFWAPLGSFVSSGAIAVLLPFVIIGAVLVIWKIARRESIPAVLPLAYIAGTMLAYGLIFPHLFEGARYLVPMLPFVLLLVAWTIRDIFVRLLGALSLPWLRKAGRIALFIVFGGSALAGMVGTIDMRSAHYDAGLFLLNRNVDAGKWLQNNTSNNALVATHLPGAVGYYGGRAIIDFSGVASPEMIPSIGDLGSLQSVLVARNAQYLVANRDQFEVVNVKPRFTSSILKPSITEVLPFIPGRTLIVPQQASRMNATAEALLSVRRTNEALSMLQESFKLERRSCRTNLLLGYALLDKKDTLRAVPFIQESLRLYPDFATALELMGNIYFNQDSLSRASLLLARALELEPASRSIALAARKAIVKKETDSLARLGLHTFTIRQRQ